MRKKRTSYRVIQVPVEEASCDERDRRYVEGYRRKPEGSAWGQLGAKLLARRLRQDRW